MDAGRFFVFVTHLGLQPNFFPLFLDTAYKVQCLDPVSKDGCLHYYTTCISGHSCFFLSLDTTDIVLFHYNCYICAFLFSLGSTTTYVTMLNSGDQTVTTYPAVKHQSEAGMTFSFHD